MGEANRRMKGQRPDSIRSFYEVLYLFQNQKFDTSYSRMTSPEFPSLSQWVLTPIKLSYSRTKKMNLFKMLDFQRIHFFRKRPWKCAISSLNQIVEISLLSRIIRFQVNAPFEDFLIVITNFWEP